LRSRLVLDFERFRSGLPPDIRAHARERYGVDLTGRYAGRSVRLPVGKASGQLSMNAAQVRTDAEAGLGFVVLKTVIAEDERGERSMSAWAVHETAMEVHLIASRAGREGWTVTWKGRGWDRTLSEYVAFYRAALEIGTGAEMPVAASVKYHLPILGEPFREGEYRFTTSRLLEAGAPAVIEKDFSPTLAGDDRARGKEAVLRWLTEVPGLIKRSGDVTLGLKLMNALLVDDFQVEMLRSAAAAPEVDFLVLFNRLFDPARGVAFGGWDLSDRNLRVLDAFIAASSEFTTSGSPGAPGGTVRSGPIAAFSATGNICSGRMIVEYALRGATSSQLHTFFQLPASSYSAALGSRTASALHTLIYHPEDGLIAWIAHLGETGQLARRDGLLHFLDIALAAARHAA
jgi:hypothetical protein